MFVKNITRNNIDWDDKTKRAFIFYEHAKTTFLYMVEFWCMIWSLSRRGEVFCKSNVVRIIYFAQMARNYMTYIPFILCYTKGGKVWGFVWNIDKTGLNINKHSRLDATQWLAISGLYCSMCCNTCLFIENRLPFYIGSNHNFSHTNLST